MLLKLPILCLWTLVQNQAYHFQNYTWANLAIMLSACMVAII